jgi:dipeptidyl-peptidase-4
MRGRPEQSGRPFCMPERCPLASRPPARRNRAFFLVPVAATAQVPATVQAPVAQRLTLERVFASPALTGQVPRSPKLSPDGKLVTLLRNRPDDLERYDLWAIDPATGAQRMLVDSKKFATGATLSEAERMQRERARIANLTGIVAYDWAPDGKHIVVPLDGDIYLADLAGNVKRLTNTKGSELNATASERSRYVSFVRDNELYALDLATGKERKLTSGASDTISWGLAEFIAQEELGTHQGPLVGAQRQPHRGRAGRRQQGRSRDARRDRRRQDDHLRTTLSARRHRQFGGRSLSDEPRRQRPGSRPTLAPTADIYLARVDWLPDSSGLIVQRESRDQKRLDVLRVDAKTGASTLLFSDTSDLWINLSDDLKPLKDGSILFSSERSGYRQLYRWARGKITPLTSGSWVLDGGRRRR